MLLAKIVSILMFLQLNYVLKFLSIEEIYNVMLDQREYDAFYGFILTIPFLFIQRESLAFWWSGFCSKNIPEQEEK